MHKIMLSHDMNKTFSVKGHIFYKLKRDYNENEVKYIFIKNKN